MFHATAHMASQHLAHTVNVALHRQFKQHPVVDPISPIASVLPTFSMTATTTANISASLN
jgi:hypothetical protein